jgi:tripartite ATP-independent transporter DctP family solute receptor
MLLSRRRVLATGSLMVGGILAAPYVARAQQAEFRYKWANNQPLSHPTNVRGQEAVEAIKAETNGRVEIQIFPSNQLGSDTDTLSQLRSGGVEFFSLSGLILANLVPAASINGIAFAFPDYPAVWRAMDGELGGYVRQQVARAGIIAFEKIWDNGFRQTTSSTKPINTPDDLRGFRIRVPVSPLWTSLYRALEASPVSINANEMYTALQTRIADGQENPLAIVEIFKLYEIQRYCSLTNHMWDGFWFLANRRAFERMPENLRAVVTRQFNAAADRQRQDVANLNATLRETLTQRGMVFNQPEPGPFRDKLRSAGFYTEWKGRYGEEAWANLERFTGPLG